MIVNVESFEATPEAIGVHVQDQHGVCISLQQGDHWHWISDECADQLLLSLSALPQFAAIQAAVNAMVDERRGLIGNVAT